MKTRRSTVAQILYREHEYYINKYLHFLRKEENSRLLCRYFWRRRKNVLGAKIGFYIPADTCGNNLKIWHYGSIIVNGYSHIGDNVTLHGNNCIGNDGKTLAAPTIGDNVDIGFGAIIIGNVNIANDIVIGAGAVVNKSFTEPGVIIAGVPAKIIGRKEE